ncbi:hypothetical protein DTO063F5_7227 [Paecilomyces variotii]|nr:hypothetical protein DTO063F5_7227 [Paecilomyces variotii]
MSSLLLCWGTSSNARMWPIKVANPDNEIVMARYPPRIEVEIVEISIAGSDPRAIKNPTWMNRYVGTFMKEYIRTKKKRLEHAIHNYQEQEYQCAYDPTTGETDCHRMCVSQLGLDISCPEKNLFKAQRDLEYLNLRSESLKFTLTQPHSAAPFDLLSREHVILSHLDILGQLDTWHSPELEELRFPKLIIREGLEFNRQHIVLPLSVTVFFIMVVTAKLTYND